MGLHLACTSLSALLKVVKPVFTDIHCESGHKSRDGAVAWSICCPALFHHAGPDFTKAVFATTRAVGLYAKRFMLNWPQLLKALEEAMECLLETFAQRKGAQGLFPFISAKGPELKKIR